MISNTNLHVASGPIQADPTVHPSGTATLCIRQGENSVTLYFSADPAEQHGQISNLSAALFNLGLQVAQAGHVFDVDAA